MPVKFATQSQARKYSVSNAMAPAHIEGITPTKHLEQNLADYIYGKKSIAQLVKEIKQRHAVNQIR